MCKNVLNACVPPSITNRASFVPFVFSSDDSKTDDIFFLHFFWLAELTCDANRMFINAAILPASGVPIWTSNMINEMSRVKNPGQERAKRHFNNKFFWNSTCINNPNLSFLIFLYFTLYKAFTQEYLSKLITHSN